MRFALFAFSAALLLGSTACSDGDDRSSDAGPGGLDSGSTDAGSPSDDGGSGDDAGGPVDAGEGVDAGATDGGGVGTDAGARDAAGAPSGTCSSRCTPTCFRPITCVTVCGGPETMCGCCECEAPSFDPISCGT